MSKEKNTFTKGSTVSHSDFGEGMITSIDRVESASDDNNTVYTVKFTDGVSRHFKDYELKN